MQKKIAELSAFGERQFWGIFFLAGVGDFAFSKREFAVALAFSDTARELGVVIDRELSLAAHVSSVCRSGYNQLRQLRPVVSK